MANLNLESQPSRLTRDPSITFDEHDADASMACTTAQSSQLLNIAPELRNIIYRLVLTTENIINVEKRTLPTRKSLLATCTQIREEALAIFYSENRFRILGGPCTSSVSILWLGALAGKGALIKRVVINVQPSLLDFAEFVLDMGNDPTAETKISDIKNNNEKAVAIYNKLVHREKGRISPLLTAVAKAGIAQEAVEVNMRAPENQSAEAKRNAIRTVRERERQRAAVRQ